MFKTLRRRSGGRCETSRVLFLLALSFTVVSVRRVKIARTSECAVSDGGFAKEVFKFTTKDVDENFESSWISRYARSGVHLRGINASLRASHRSALQSQREVRLLNVLEHNVAASFRRRLMFLENRLSSLTENDLRWCARYCKNLFYFSSGSRAFATALVSSLAEIFQWEGDLVILNDELSYNIPGEKHYYDWHLDVGAWAVIPESAWAMTIYVPLDTATEIDGGGWLRFRGGAGDYDEYFIPGDVLVFDRWIVHKLADFKKDRAPRVAYLIRVTNSSQFIKPEYSAASIPRLSQSEKYVSGAHINYICSDSALSCRLSIHDFLKTRSFRHPVFELNTTTFLSSSARYRRADERSGKLWMKAMETVTYMCEQFMNP